MLLLLLVEVLLSTPREPVLRASASDGSEGHPSVSVEAASAFKEGEAAYHRGDFAEAVEHFGQAHRASPHASTLFNLGLSLQRMNDLVRAYQTFERLLDEGTTPLIQADAKLKLLELAHHLSFVRIDRPGLRLACIDGRRLEPKLLDRAVPLMPGQHVLRVDEWVNLVDLAPGETRSIHLAPRLANPPPPRGAHTSLALFAIATAASAAAGAFSGWALADALEHRASPTPPSAGVTASGVAFGVGVSGLVFEAIRLRKARAAQPRALPPNRCSR